MLSKIVKFLLLTEAFAIATFALGWWGVVVLAFAWGLAVEPRARSISFATVCAAAGWASLLLLDAARGPVSEVAARFGGVMGVSTIVLYGITLLFPALLAMCASTLGATVRRVAVARRGIPGESAEIAPISHPRGVVAADA